MYEFNVCGSVVGSACGNASSLMGKIFIPIIMILSFWTDRSGQTVWI